MKNIEKIIQLVGTESSTNGKIEILNNNKDNEVLQEVLYYTYNPEMKYKLTTSQLRKKSDGRTSKWNDIFNMLDELSESNINDELRAEVLAFLDEREDLREFYTRMICKDFKIGVKVKTINKVWDKLIPTFEVQKPEANAKLKLKPNELFMLQLKENGSRGIYYRHDMKTRQNKEHFWMNHIVDQVESVFGKDYIVDGELICKLEDGMTDNQRLRKTISILNAKEYFDDKLKIEFKIFDIISREEFESENFKSKYISDRMPLLKSFEDKLNNTTHLSLCEVMYVGTDQSEIQKNLDIVDSKGLEGLCLYKDALYKKGKTTNVIKVKTFMYVDLPIKGWFLGEIGSKLEGCFGGFIVDYKGYDLRVGGGFTDEDREIFGADPEHYVGRIIEVKAKGESKNERGGLSLQFPVYQILRSEDKEVNYES